MCVWQALSILHRGVRRRCLDFEMPRCVVPSIGLHLNAIAMSCKDNNVSKQHSYTGNVKVGLQSSTTPALPSNDIVRESEAREAVEEAPMSLALVEVNQSSPKKKRQVVSFLRDLPPQIKIIFNFLTIY